jgi:hypothetical protein
VSLPVVTIMQHRMTTLCNEAVELITASSRRTHIGRFAALAA